MATPSRQLAFQILNAIKPRGAILSELLSQPSAEALGPRDRSLLHELVLGTLRRRGELDAILGSFLDRPFSEIDPPQVQNALRLGAYQIVHLRIPDRAAVSESVDLVRAVAPRATGYVNAVLRRLAREGPPPPVDPQVDVIGWLTTTGSLPAWLAHRWLDALGPGEAVNRARAFLEPPPVAFRPNPHRPEAWARVEAAGLDPQPLTVPGAWRARRGKVADLGQEGLVYVQDEGSQLVAHLAARRGRMLDACAAPGGKALLMADQQSAEGFVVAADAAPLRLRTLSRLARRWGASNVACLGADARHLPFRVRFASVLLDAPCSGLGTLGRHPDIRWRLEAEDVARHAARQRELLGAVCPHVEPGGRLAYSVCSLEPEEGKAVVDDFLTTHPEFHPETLPEWVAPFAHGRDLRTLPERGGGDGFFLAVLKRD